MQNTSFHLAMTSHIHHQQNYGNQVMYRQADACAAQLTLKIMVQRSKVIARSNHQNINIFISGLQSKANSAVRPM